MLCRTCGAQCNDVLAGEAITIECPVCNGVGCNECVDGEMEINECPQKFVGNEMIKAINLAGMCGQGDWPVEGGLLKQAAWFLDLKRTMDSEQNKIEAEQMEKASG